MDKTEIDYHTKEPILGGISILLGVLILLGLLSIIFLAFYFGEEEHKQSVLKDKEDRVLFEKIFEAPANKQGSTESLKEVLRHAKVQKKLLSHAQTILSEHEKLKNIPRTHSELTYEKQIKLAEQTLVSINIYTKEFIDMNRLAERYDGSPIYTGIFFNNHYDEKRGILLLTYSDWDTIVKRLKYDYEN